MERQAVRMGRQARSRCQRWFVLRGTANSGSAWRWGAVVREISALIDAFLRSVGVGLGVSTTGSGDSGNEHGNVLHWRC